MNDLELLQWVKLAYHTVNLVKINAYSLALPSDVVLEKVLYGEDRDGMRPFGLIVTKGDTTVVAFRGTEAWSEWYTDCEIELIDSKWGKGRVHGGFFNLYQSIVDQDGNTNWRQSLRSRNVFVTGHSLGAALATYTALDIGSRALVTFGSPKCGDKDFAEDAQDTLGESKRYNSKFDPVPILPLSTYHVAYAHFCKETLIWDKDNRILSPGKNHSLDRYAELVGNVVP